MNNTLKYYIMFIGLLLAFNAKAQVGIGTNVPDASAQLEVLSSSKGLLIPRMSFVQRSAINSPANGLLIYQTNDSPGFYYYNGQWQRLVNSSELTSGGNGGNTILNGNTNPASAIGLEGDFYLNTSSAVLYGPKTSTGWSSNGIALVGPKGEPGSGGSTGAAVISFDSAYNLSVKDGNSVSLSDLNQSLSLTGPILSISGPRNSKVDFTSLIGGGNVLHDASLTGNGTTSGLLGLSNTAVTPGSYTAANITVDANGRITAARDGSAGGVSDATAVTKGVVRLANDLGGTADAPTVPGLLLKEPIISNLPVTKGGTGITSYTSGNFISALDATTLQQRTPTQVKAALGLDQVSNTSDAEKQVSTATQTALNLKEDKANKSTDGTFTANSDNNYPTEKATKTYVDGRVTTAITGITVPDATTTVKGKIQLAGDLAGTASAPTVPGLSLKEPIITNLPVTKGGTGITSYTSGNFISALDATTLQQRTPTQVKAALDLDQVSNTSDAEKQVSTATQTALNLKEDKANKSTDGTFTANSDNSYPTEKATKTYVDGRVNIAIAGITVPDATTIATGKIQLAGDLAGTASAPTVPGLSLKEPIITNLPVTKGGTGITSYTPGNFISALDASTLRQRTPAQVKSDLSLDQVSNSSDANKPVSNATQTQLNSKIDITEKAAVNGVATLDAIGKIPSSQIPAISFSSVDVLNSEAAMLALVNPSVGSTVIRTDESRSYVLAATPGSILVNWKEILTPGSGVQSVNGYSGNVSLTKTDILLGDVDNTRDSAKPVSAATQTELNKKEDTANRSIDVAGDGTLDSKYPSVKATKTYVDTNVATKQNSDADLTAIAGLGANGIIVRTGNGTATARTITGTTDVVVSSGDGVAAGPSIALSNTAVIAGDYIAANITVDAKGRITAATNGSAGGAVSTVSVVTANGISGSVANAATTPAITLTLGAITPTSIVATGNVLGANLTGTNTGDQVFTGEVTSSGNVTTIANKAVTLAKMNDVATGTVFYRKTAATGVPEVQSLSTLKADLGLTGTNSGDQIFTGDVTSAGSVTTIGLAKVTYAKMQTMTANKLLGSGLSGTAVSEITLGTGLSFTGTTLNATGGGGATNLTYTSSSTQGLVNSDTGTDATIPAGSTTDASLMLPGDKIKLNTISGTNTGDQVFTGEVTSSGNVTTIANKAVTLAKMNDVATGTVFYRKTAATGVPEVQSLSTLKTDLGLTGTNSGDQIFTGDVTSAGSVTTIGLAKVTYAKMQTMTANKLLGSGLSGTAVSEITLGTGLSFTGTTLNATGGGGATNLTYTSSSTQGLVNSDTGTDAIIPAGSTTNASLMIPEDKTKMDKMAAIVGASDANKVLTVNGDGTGAVWVTAAAGGGGNIIYSPADIANSLGANSPLFLKVKASGPGITVQRSVGLVPGSIPNKFVLTVPDGVTLNAIRMNGDNVYLGKTMGDTAPGTVYIDIVYASSSNINTSIDDFWGPTSQEIINRDLAPIRYVPAGVSAIQTYVNSYANNTLGLQFTINVKSWSIILAF